MKVISIANQKGGCGKTTTTINLATALSLNGKRVLLLDLDPQAHASLGLDVESQDSIYNVISRLTPRKLKIENIIKRVEDTFDIAPSNILVGTLEQELSDEIGRELKLKEVIEPLRDQYDYVLIDCPPSLGILTVNAIRVSDELIIPVETSRFSLQGVDHLMSIVDLIKDRLNHEVKCRVLVTMFDSRLRHSFAMLSTFKERFKEYLFDNIIHTNVKLKEAAVMGRPVAFYDKYCRGSKDYYSLAKEILLADGQSSKEIEEIIEKSADTREAIEAKIKRSVEAAAQRAVEAESEKFSDFVEVNAEIKSEDEDLDREITELAATVSAEKKTEFSAKMQETIKQEVKQFEDFIKTAFRIEALGARSVYVTGSFNDWSLDDTCRLKEKSEGRWEVDIPLKPGLYKYQFIVDGVWKEDPENSRRERNSFGDINSLIEVAAK